MSDITFTRGYGFPRGSAMDYAGLGRASFAGRGFGVLVNTRQRRRSALSAIPSLPEPSIFAKIPALDGLGEDFGSAYTFAPRRMARYGEGGTLPTYHAETDTWTTDDGTTVAYGPAAPPGCSIDATGRTICPPTGGNTTVVGRVLAVGAGLAVLYWLFGR